MARQSGQFTYGVNFEVNDAGLKKVKQYLEEFKKLSVDNFLNQSGEQSNKTLAEYAQQLGKLKKDAATLTKIMQASFNPKLNTYNIDVFNQKMSNAGLSIKGANKELSNFAKDLMKTSEGRAFLNTQMNELTKFNTKIKESHTLLDRLGRTLTNVIQWNISSFILNSVTQPISQAWGFAKNLDGALNDIRIVTGKSADEMARFAENANRVASNLGKGTNDYTRAALIYAQQGLGDKQIEKRTEITLKTANVTGQSTEEVSEELTSVWNGYKASASEAELYVDRLAAVASTTASDLQELSISMSKVASAAASLGVGEEQLAAQLSTIISVTRQAPETVGTALRTVYARITDIEAGMDEQGVTLGEYSGKMAEVGINVLDVNGKLRSMGEVMEQIGAKWGALTKEQRIYLAQTMAGQRQYSNLVALFDNFDKYQSALNTAQNAQGTLQKQQDIYMDRLTTHLQQLTTATEHMWMGLVDTDDFKGVIDGLTFIIEKVDSLFQSLGGGKALIQSLIPLVGAITSKSIAKSINSTIIEGQSVKRQKIMQDYALDMAQRNANTYAKKFGTDNATYKVWNRKAEILKQKPGYYSEEQLQNLNTMFGQQKDLANQIDAKRTNLKISQTGFLKSILPERFKENKDISIMSREELNNIFKEAESVVSNMSEYLGDLDLKKEKQNWLKFSQIEKEAEEGIKNAEQDIENAEKDIENAEQDIENAEKGIKIVNQIIADSQTVSKNKYSLLTFLEKISGPEKKQENDFLNKLQEWKENIEKNKEEAERTKTAAEKNKEEAEGTKAAAEKNKEDIRNQLSIQKLSSQNIIETLFNNLSDLNVEEELKKTDSGKQILSIKNDIKKLDEQIEQFNKKLKENGITDDIKKQALNIQQQKETSRDALIAYIDKHGSDFFLMLQEIFTDEDNEEGLSEQHKQSREQQEEDKNRQNKLQYAISGISMLGQFSGVTNSLLHIGEVLNDKTLSGWEKADQAMSNIVANATSLIPGILQMKQAYSKLTPELQKSTMGLSAWIVGIYAFLTIYKTIGNIVENNNKAIIKNNEEIIKQEKQKQEQIQHNKDIIVEVEALNNQYEQGIISTSELKAKTEELQQKYKDESKDIKNLISDYRNLGEAAEEAKRKQLQAESDSLKTTAQAQRTLFITKGKGTASTREGLFSLVDEVSGMNFFEKLNNKKVFNSNWIFNDTAMQLGMALKKVGLGNWTGTSISLNNMDAEGTETQVKFLRNYINNLNDEELGDPAIRSILDWLPEMESLLQNWRKEQLENIDTIAQQVAIANKEYFKDVDSLQEFHSAYEEAYKNAKERLSQEDGWEELSKIDQEQKIKKAVENELSSDLISKYGIKEQIIFPYANEGGVDNLLELIDKLDENQLNEVLRLKDLIKDSKTLENVLEEVFKHDYSLKINNADLEEADEIYEKTLAIYEKIEAGKKISNKDFKEIPENILSDQDKEDYFRKTYGGHLLNDQSKKEQLEDKLLDNSYETYRKDIEQIKASIPTDPNKLKNRISSAENKQLNLDFQDTALYSEEDIRQAQKVIDGITHSKGRIDQLIEGYQKAISADMITATTGIGYFLNPVAAGIGYFLNSATTDKMPFQASLYKKDLVAEQLILKDLERRADNAKDILKWNDEYGSQNDTNNTNFENANSMIKFLTQFKEDGKIQSTLAALVDDEGRMSLDKGQVDKEKYNDLLLLYTSTIDKYKKQIEEAAEKEKELEEAYLTFHDVLFPIDDDVDETIVAKLGKQFQLTAKQSVLLSDELKNNARKAKDVAQETERYNAALTKIIDNYSNWIQILKTGETAEKIAIAPQIKDTMADVLGISEKSISDTFATTVENLENVKLALQGNNEGAYKALQKAAYQDILLRIKPDNQSLLKDLNTFFNQIDLDKIKIGAEINFDEVDEEALKENIIPALIKAGLDTEQKLEALFALKGIDLDIALSKNKQIYWLQMHKSATYELKEQEKSQEKIRDLERDRIRNQKELTEFLKDERDLYHQINILLKEQERIIARVTKNQDKMYGAELIKNLRDQNKERKEQNSLLQSKQNIAKQIAADTKSQLASYGATFDQYGNISNYNQIQANIINGENALIAKLRGIEQAQNNWLNNGGNQNDDYYQDLQLEHIQVSRSLDNMQKTGDEFNRLSSQYESSLQIIEDTTDSLTENIQRQIEEKLQQFDMKVQLTLDISQAEKTWNEYKRNVLQHDDIFNPNKALTAQRNNAQKLANINSNSQSMTALEQNMKDILDGKVQFNTQGQKRAKLNEYLQKITELRTQTLELEDEIKQAYLEQYDIIQETFDTQKNQYEFIKNQYEHDKKMSELIYGEKNYDINDIYFNKQKENNLKLLDSLNQQVQFYAEQQKQENINGNAEAARIAHQKWQESISKRNALTQESAQLLKDQYSNAIEQISHQMEMKLTNNQGFNYLDTQWDLLKKNSNLYLDDINSTFAIKDIQYKFTQAINDIDELKTQQQLKQVMDEQLSILKEKEKITQYDVDRAEKVLEIEKARIALEQARNNKTQMRLKRDSQGNYSYQYVADQDKIAEAEQNLAKAENDLYNFDKQNYQKNLEEAYNTTKEYHEKRNALQMELVNANEERQKQIYNELKLLQEEYSNYIISLVGETEWTKINLMDSAVEAAKELMAQEQIVFEDMTEAQKQKWLGDMVPAINSGIAEMISKFSEDPDSFKNIVVKATQEMDNARLNYQNGLTDLEQKAGESFLNIKNGIDQVVNSENSLITDNNTLLSQAQKISEEFSKTIESLKEHKKAWEGVYSAIDNTVNRAVDYQIALGNAGLEYLKTNNNSNSGGGGRTGGGTTTIPNPGTLNATGETPRSGSNRNPLKTETESQSVQTSIEDIYDLANYFMNYNNLQDWNFLHQNGEHQKAEARIVFRDNVNQFGQYLSNLIRDKQSKGNIDIDITNFREQLLDLIKSYDDYDSHGIGDWLARFTTLPATFLNKIYNNPFEIFSKFDTGGYTGDWSSSEGRMAILHEKELVLNKQDTVNMLKMLEIVRDAQQMTLNTKVAQFNNRIQDILKQGAQVEKIQSQKDSLEQSVEITATFPNVNSKKEIEEALLDLTNKATQFALKYKK